MTSVPGPESIDDLLARVRVVALPMRVRFRGITEREVALIRPQLLVAMGATALQALTGKGAGILKRRGGIERTPEGVPVLVTVHPSYLLRLPDPELARTERAAFRADLAQAAGWL